VNPDVDVGLAAGSPHEDCISSRSFPDARSSPEVPPPCRRRNASIEPTRPLRRGNVHPDPTPERLQVALNHRRQVSFWSSAMSAIGDAGKTRPVGPRKPTSSSLGRALSFHGCSRWLPRIMSYTCSPPLCRTRCWGAPAFSKKFLQPSWHRRSAPEGHVHRRCAVAAQGHVPAAITTNWSFPCLAARIPATGSWPKPPTVVPSGCLSNRSCQSGWVHALEDLLRTVLAGRRISALDRRGP